MAASSKSASELRCQDPDCAAVLDVSAIPVEYQTILQELFRGAAAGGAGARAPPLPLPADASVAVPRWDDLRDAAKRGDSVAFGVITAGLLSPLAGVDLPLCDGCMEAALRRKTRECNDAVDERDGVLALRQALAEPRRGAPGDAAPALRAAAAALAREEAALVADLAALNARLDAARGGLARLRSHAARVDALEADTWAAWRDAAGSLARSRERMLTLLDVTERRRGTLGKLRTLSLPGDAFFIWHRGPFGTINGARLGRLGAGQVPVEWPEINAALGQAVTLLSVVAARLGYVFAKHRLVPMGSFSRIAPAADEKAASELYFDGRLFAARRLNAGLRAFVSCIGELGDYAQAVDRSFRLPYAVSPGGDRVHDLAVGYGMGKDAAWTRALKLALIDLKWLLAFACRQAE